MTTLQTLVLRILANGDRIQSDATALAKLAAAMPFAKFNDAVAVIVGTKYAVEPYESRKGGLLTFEKDSAAEQRFKRLIKLHPDYPTTKPDARNAKTEPVAVPRRLVTQTRDAIVAQSLTRAQFDAFIAELRKSVAFE